MSFTEDNKENYPGNVSAEGGLVCKPSSKALSARLEEWKKSMGMITNDASHSGKDCEQFVKEEHNESFRSSTNLSFTPITSNHFPFKKAIDQQKKVTTERQVLSVLDVSDVATKATEKPVVRVWEEKMDQPVQCSTNNDEVSAHTIALPSTESPTVGRLSSINWDLDQTPQCFAKPHVRYLPWSSLANHKPSETDPENATETPISPCSSPNVLAKNESNTETQCTEVAMEQPSEPTGTDTIEADLRREIAELRAALEEQQRARQGLEAVLQAYDQTFEELVTKQECELEQERRAHAKAQEELKKSKEDVVALAESFTQLRKRYEDMKGVNENLKKNETTLLQRLRDAENERNEFEAKFEALKAHAEQKLSLASEELENVKASCSKQITVLQTRTQLLESRANTLQDELRTKEKENLELVQICEQLMTSIEPVGGSENGARV
jgi:predicted DNA binding CopG/RHH family protein